MKQVNGTFIGKTKVSNDSKYINGIGLDEDIAKTNSIKEDMQRELNQILDKYKRKFRMFETAEDLYLETLREEAIKIIDKQK